jgi:hypothetical protein
MTTPNDDDATGLEECEDNDCSGCPYCDAMGYTHPLTTEPGTTPAKEG